MYADYGFLVNFPAGFSTVDEKDLLRHLRGFEFESELFERVGMSIPGQPPAPTHDILKQERTTPVARFCRRQARACAKRLNFASAFASVDMDVLGGDKRRVGWVVSHCKA